MKPTRWGIIGPGSIAEAFVKDLVFVTGSHIVTTVLGRSDSSIESFQKKFNVPAGFKNINEFLAVDNIDVVYIATPHPFHFEAALMCLQHKIPVLCEKPLCLNQQQCEQLIEQSRSSNTFMMEAMWIRFLPGIKNAFELVRHGAIGELLTIHGSMHYRAPQEGDSRYFNPTLGGGSLLDLGIYPVFLAVLMHGVPETVKAVSSLTDKGIDQSSSIIFNYSDGCQALLESSLRMDSDTPAEIKGTKGSLKILHPWFEKSPGLEIISGDNKTTKYPFHWEGHGLHFEIEETLKCISEGKIESDLMPHSLSLDVIRILDEVRRQTGVKYEQYE